MSEKPDYLKYDGRIPEPPYNEPRTEQEIGSDKQVCIAQSSNSNNPAPAAGPTQDAMRKTLELAQSQHNNYKTFAVETPRTDEHYLEWKPTGNSLKNGKSWADYRHAEQLEIENAKLKRQLASFLPFSKRVKELVAMIIAAHAKWESENE